MFLFDAYYIIGVVVMYRRMRDLFDRLDREHPRLPPCQWRPADTFMMLYTALFWPVCVVIDSFIEEPLGTKPRKRP